MVKTKQGISTVVVVLGLIAVAAIAVGIIASIVISVIGDAEKQAYSVSKGVAVLTDKEHCPGGVTVAVIQNAIRSDNQGDKVQVGRQIYQISNDIDEKFWNADFTGDGQVNKVIKRIDRATESTLKDKTAVSGYELHRKNAGIAIYHAGGINRDARSDSANGLYDSILWFMFDRGDKTKKHFILSAGITNTSMPVDPQIKVPKYPDPTSFAPSEADNKSTKWEFFAFRYAITLNRNLVCWTVSRISDHIPDNMMTTTTAGN